MECTKFTINNFLIFRRIAYGKTPSVQVFSCCKSRSVYPCYRPSSRAGLPTAGKSQLSMADTRKDFLHRIWNKESSVGEYGRINLFVRVKNNIFIFSSIEKMENRCFSMMFCLSQRGNQSRSRYAFEVNKHLRFVYFKTTKTSHFP